MLSFIALGYPANNDLLLGPPSAPDQTATASPLIKWDFNYGIKLEQQVERTARFPTLQSFSFGQTDSGLWVLFGGRSNGLHGFNPNDSSGILNFPPAFQNKDVWVYDPVRDLSWSRSWSESGLSEDIQLSMSTTNAQAFQQGNVLFRTGGYVYDSVNKTFETRNRLSAVDLGDLANWVIDKSKKLPVDSVLSVAGTPLKVDGKDTNFFAVTGGDMLPGTKANQAQLIFGQDFSGAYGPNSNGLYTSQVRNFEFYYDRVEGGRRLDYKIISVSTPNETAYRRRDGNVVPHLSIDKNGQLSQHAEALGGVFYNGSGVWTVPVGIDLLTGQPNMVDPLLPGTFRQAVNQYTAANLGLYSRSRDRQTDLIFGGISAITLDPSGQPYYVNQYNAPNVAFAYPFTSQNAALTRNSDGTWSQSLVGTFPAISRNGKPLTFGAASSFIPVPKGQDPRVIYLADGVLDLDLLTRRTNQGDSVLVGYVVGGIQSQVFNDFSNLSTYGSTNYSLASGEIFKVYLNPFLNPFAPSAAITQSAYRLYNRTTGDYLFTTSQSEFDIVTGSPINAFVNEGVAFSAPSYGGQSLHRFINMSTGLHFYTANDIEENTLASNPSSGYQYEGTAFTVYGASSAPSDATPVYRFYNQANSQHFFSASPAEVANIQSTQPSWKFEGVAWYA